MMVVPLLYKPLHLNQTALQTRDGTFTP